jgi:hypothetical protein
MMCLYRGFRQETRGLEAGAYSHPLFRRDQPEWCLQMTCDRTGTARKALLPTPTTTPKRIVATLVTPVSAPRTVTRRTSPPPELPPSNNEEQPPVRSTRLATLSEQALPLKSEVVVTDTEDSMSTSCAASVDGGGAAATTSAPHTLTSATVVTALSRHNTVLSQQAVARRNQAERLQVAQQLLLQNYLAALEMKAPAASAID